MVEDNDRAKEALIKELGELWFMGSNLMGDQMERRVAIRDKWKGDAGNFIDAHQFSFAIVANALLRRSGDPAKGSVSISRRLSLIASFVHGVDVTEVTISEGLYIQASALLKQEMETIVAIDEIANERRRDGRTPNVGNSPFQWMKAAYSDLNDAAHVGSADVLHGLVSRQISEDVVGASLYPLYNRDLSVYFYGLQVTLIVILAYQVEELHEEMYGDGLTEKERATVMLVGQILQEMGWLESREKVRPKEDKQKY